MRAVTAKKIFNGLCFIDATTIILDDTHTVVAIGEADLIETYKIAPSACQTTAYTLAPAFVDIQVNGAGGQTFYGDGLNQKTLQVMQSTLKGFGCHHFCPTIVSATADDIVKAIKLLQSIDLDSFGILGLHIEGPMLSQEHKGAHNPDLLKVLDNETLEFICNSGVVAMVSLAPEIVPKEYISRLVASGIRVSIAHTNANFKEVRQAELQGATLATHLYNGMSRFNSREPNAVGAILTSSGLCATIIPDGHHADFNAIILAHRILGKRLLTITDGMMVMGTNLTEFNIGHQHVRIDENRRLIGAYGGLAGSLISPIECMQNLVKHCEYSLAEALYSYSYGPSLALARTKACGTISIGSKASLIAIDESDLSLKSL